MKLGIGWWLGAVMLAGCAVAQTNTGSIVGRVTDPKGVAVAGASVVVKNTDLGATRTVLSDARGEFRVDGLVPGANTVESKGKGLATRRPVRVTLGLGSTVRVSLAMAVPAVSTRTTVTGRAATSEGNTLAPEVNRDAALVSSFFTGNMVTYLPLRDRDFAQFGQLGAGVAEDEGGSGVVVAGQRATATATQVDGVSFNDPLHGGRRGAGDGTFFLPQTMVREFQIVRSGATAEVGGTNAGLMNVATKEGSNKLHGEAFYTVRPGWATSADAFGHGLDERQNVFGFSLGGPVRKDKAFWYAGFEQDFLRNPYYVQFAPQAAGVTVPGALAGLQGQVPQTSSPTAAVGRGDAVLGKSNTLNVLVAVNRIRSSNAGDGSGTRSIATADHADAVSGQSVWAKAGLTTVLNERSVSQMVVSWSGDHRNRAPNSAAPEQVVNGFGTLGGDALGPQIYTSQQTQVGETVSVSRGRMSFEGGGGFAYAPAYEQQEANLRGRYDYNSLGDYLASTPRRFQQTFVTGNTRYQGAVRGLGLFATGKMAVRGNVTLTAGLRWDGQWNPQPGTSNAALAVTRAIPADLGQWQPRLGAAWTPGRKTVVRASAGIYDAPTPATFFHRVFADDGVRTVVADSYFDPLVLLAAGGVPHTLTVIPAGLTTPQALVVGIGQAGAQGFRNPRSMQLAANAEHELTAKLTASVGYVHGETWALERRVDENLGVPTVGPTGLPVFPAARPIAGVGRLLVNGSTAHSDYSGLLVSAKEQINARSQVTLNYTFSGTHDDDSGTGPYGIDAALSPYNLRAERAYSAQDVRQMLNVSAILNFPFGLKCNPVFTARSGRPYTPIVGFDTQRDANDWNDRALIGQVEAGRNSVRQPAFTNVDVRFVKDFTLKGTGHHLDLFMDVFNLGGAGNREFGPGAVSLYGTSASPVASAGQALFAPDATRLGGPRAVQFTARLVAF